MREEREENYYYNDVYESGKLETVIEMTQYQRYADCPEANMLIFLARTDVSTNLTQYVLQFGLKREFGYILLKEIVYDNYGKADNDYHMQNNLVYQVMREHELQDSAVRLMNENNSAD